MGTAVAFLTIEAVCPILIVKDHIDRSKKVNNAYSHCLCFDGSEQSVKSLYLIRKVIWPQDKLVIIICDQKGLDVGKIQNQAEALIKEDGFNNKYNFEVL